MTNTDSPLVVGSLSKVPGHSMYGEWAVPPYEQSFLNLVSLVRQCGNNRKPSIISFDEVAGKPADWFGGNDFSGSRFRKADPKFPGIVVDGMPNPERKRYRLVDGRRRLHKLKCMGKSEGPFFVFEYSEIKPFIQEFKLK